MNDIPDWLPKLIRIDQFVGDWKRYIEEVFSVFYRDFINSQPRYAQRWVRCRRDPIMDGKEAGFWHCTSEGTDENNRIPDLRRCERIGWIRAIIENSIDKSVKIWECRKKSDHRIYLWFNEEFLVVLGDRKKHVQLITAFVTDRKHTIYKLRKEYARSKNS